MERTCWLCGRNGATEALEKHHIFGAAYRKKSEKLGLTVYLCGESCHRNGPKAAHRNAETMRKLHEYGQRLAMERYGWTEEEFRAEFGGKSYLSEEPTDKPEAAVAFGFVLLPETAELPY